jgi:hypothetical protein
MVNQWDLNCQPVCRNLWSRWDVRNEDISRWTHGKSGDYDVVDAI